MSSTVIPRLLAAALGLALSCAPAAAAQHEYGSFHVAVEDDTSAILSASDYQILVEQDALLLARLTAPYQGTLSNSFVADLDHDGAFEVVVTFSHDQGRASGVHLYTWKDHHLQPLAIAALDAAQAEGYRGDDQYAVDNGELVRIFQIYEASGDTWVPTARQRRLRYSLQERRWLAR